MAGLVVVVVLLVLACVYHLLWVVGVGAFLGLGVKDCIRAHCRVHVQHRVSVRCLVGGGCLHASLTVVGVGVCGGLFVICIVHLRFDSVSRETEA